MSKQPPTYAVTRDDWQKIAEERLIAARTLLAASNWSSAYYLAGYAVECGLKSCILAYVASTPHAIFLEKRYSEKCWTHDIVELAKLAGLGDVRESDIIADIGSRGNWSIATKWTEISRYELKSQLEAESLYKAIADDTNGVMQWIRARW